MRNIQTEELKKLLETSGLSVEKISPRVLFRSNGFSLFSRLLGFRGKTHLIIIPSVNRYESKLNIPFHRILDMSVSTASSNSVHYVFLELDMGSKEHVLTLRHIDQCSLSIVFSWLKDQIGLN
ncbi:MAG: hypothetical protein AAF519_15430 [Bacteroidota bacterium]